MALKGDRADLLVDPLRIAGKLQFDPLRVAGDGFAQGDFEIHFPKRFTRVMKLLAHLPYRWSFPLIRRFTGT